MGKFYLESHSTKDVAVLLHWPPFLRIPGRCSTMAREVLKGMCEHVHENAHP